MKTLLNMKIGKKIVLALGSMVFLLMGLSALSMWGTSSNQKQAVTQAQRMTKARLAESISGDTAAVALNMGRMILDKKASEDLLNRIVARKKLRLEAVEEFKRLADTPTSIKHGAEMEEI